MLILPERVDERRNDLWQVECERFAQDMAHHAEKEEAAFSEASIVGLDCCKCLSHHDREVRAESLHANSLSKRSNRDTTELGLFTFAAELKEGAQALHHSWEVWEESRIIRVYCAAERTGDDSLDLQRCGIEKTREGLHEQLKVVANRVPEDFEKRVKRGASHALRDRVRDKMHEHWNELRMSMMRRTERESASSSISSGSGFVEMGMRPSRIAGARLAACTFDFLL